MGYKVMGFDGIKTRPTKDEETESCRKSLDLQSRVCYFVHFWYIFHPKKLRIFKEEVQSFHEVES
jgi:hypothetical protein